MDAADGRVTCPPNSADVVAACELLKTLERLDSDLLPPMAERLWPLVRAWLASLDLTAADEGA